MGTDELEFDNFVVKKKGESFSKSHVTCSNNDVTLVTGHHVTLVT